MKERNWAHLFQLYFWHHVWNLLCHDLRFNILKYVSKIFPIQKCVSFLFLTCQMSSLIHLLLQSSLPMETGTLWLEEALSCLKYIYSIFLFEWNVFELLTSEDKTLPGFRSHDFCPSPLRLRSKADAGVRLQKVIWLFKLSILVYFFTVQVLFSASLKSHESWY